jgi:hypothetical protein
MTEKLSKGEIKMLAMQGVYVDDDDTDKGGIYCVRCGCRDMHVVTTMDYDSGIRRYRQCRNCGKRIRTKEMIG